MDNIAVRLVMLRIGTALAIELEMLPKDSEPLAETKILELSGKLAMYAEINDTLNRIMKDP